jgi:hypothetical protein
LFGIGMLLKISFSVYIWAPTIVATWTFLRVDRDRGKALRTLGALGCIFLIGGIIASPWYIPNLKTVVGFAVGLVFGKPFVNAGSTNVFSWSVISDFLYGITVAAVSCYYAVLLIALLPAWATLAWRKRKGTNHALVLLVWTVFPVLLAIFSVTKDTRYTASVWPAVALFLARMIRTVFDRWRLYPVVAAALMIVPAIAYTSASLPVMERFGDLRLGRWVFWSPHLVWYASIPSAEGAWGQREIFGELCRDAEQVPRGAPLFIPLAHSFLNNVNLEYLMTRLKCNVQVVGLPPSLRTSKELAEFLVAARPVYVLVVPNVPEPQFAAESLNVMKEEAEKMVTAPESGFHILYQRPLGATGKDIQIYRRN